MAWLKEAFSKDAVEQAAVLLLEQACLLIVGQRGQQQRPPPRLQEWLNACIYLFCLYAKQLGAEAWSSEAVLHADVWLAQRCRPSKCMPHRMQVQGHLHPWRAQDQVLVHALFTALRNNKMLYESAYRRAPRWEEVLRLLSRVLAHDSVCADVEPGAVLQLWLTPAPPSSLRRKVGQWLSTTQIPILDQEEHLGKHKGPLREPSFELALTSTRVNWLRAHGQVTAQIARDGFAVLLQEYQQAIWAYTVGLNLDCPAQADVIMVGLERSLMRDLLYHLANRARAGDRFSAGQISFNLTEDGRPCCFAIVEERYYSAYAEHALGYYASDTFPLLQCVLSDADGRFPWQAGSEANREQRLLFSVTRQRFRPPSASGDACPNE